MSNAFGSDGKMQGSGWADKLYWRPPHYSGMGGTVWHCFKSCAGGGWVSLCTKRAITRTGGQAIARPPSVLRCPLCDGHEMERRGWAEGGADSKNWFEFLPVGP